jgi:hypothetical protein
MNEQLLNQVRVVSGNLHVIVKELEQEILNNLTYEDTTANNYLLQRLNKMYREMANQMSDYENSLVTKIKNINWIIEEEKERAERNKEKVDNN